MKKSRSDEDGKDEEKLTLSTKDKIWLIVALAGIIAAFLFIVFYGLDFLGV